MLIVLVLLTVGLIAASLRWFGSPAHAARVLKHAIVAVGLVTVMVGLARATVCEGTEYALKWLHDLGYETTLDFSAPRCIVLTAQPTLNGSFKTKAPLPADRNPGISPAQWNRMVGQLQRVEQLIAFHFDLLRFFYAAYYMALITTAFAAAFAAIAIVLVGTSGWQQANEYVVNAFFVLTAGAIFWGSFPGLFQHDQNIRDNKTLALKYLALDDEIRSYLVTMEISRDVSASVPEPQGSPAPVAAKGKTPGAETPPAAKPESRTGVAYTPDEFIHYIDQRVAQDNIALGFDSSKAPSFKNAFDAAAGSK